MVYFGQLEKVAKIKSDVQKCSESSIQEGRPKESRRLRVLAALKDLIKTLLTKSALPDAAALGEGIVGQAVDEYSVKFRLAVARQMDDVTI